MDVSSDETPHAEESEAGEAGAPPLNNMSMATAPSADPGPTSSEKQKRRDALDHKIEELEQKLAALNQDEPPSRSSSESFRTAQEQLSVRPSEKALGKRKEQVSPKKPSPVLLPQRGSRRQSSTTAHTSSRPTTSHRPSTRRTSTAPTSQFPSASSSRREARRPLASTRPSTSSSGGIGPNPQGASSSSSRRSSFLLPQPATAQTTLPTRRHRRTNAIYPSITIHPNGRQALQSVRAFSDLQKETWAGMLAEQEQRALAASSTSLPTTLARSATTTAADPSSSSTNNPAPEETSQTPRVPASNIDWTLPSTRRREYEKIDKARRGIRGFVRRITPRFLRKKDARVGFHVGGGGGDGDDGDGGGSDAGTVRRFRMDVPEEGDGEDGVVKGKGHWWKFGKGKGKGEGEERSGTDGADAGIELRAL